MLTKEQVLETVRNMPDETIDLNILRERLITLNKLQTGIKDADDAEKKPAENLRNS